METVSRRVSVGVTVPVLLFDVPVESIQSILIKANGTCAVGKSGLDTSGYTLSNGEGISITHQDFTKEKDVQKSHVSLYAIAAVATTIDVFMFQR